MAIRRKPGFKVFNVRLLISLDKLLREKRRYQGDLSASINDEDLWKWMDTQRNGGNELLAISHNANLSDGWMYPTDVDSFGRPIDAAWTPSRDRNERLVEIKQIKGQSETHPLLSPTDEFANYEIFTGLLGAPPTVGRVESHSRKLCAAGLQRRHHHAGRAWLQLLPVRHGWLS